MKRYEQWKVTVKRERVKEVNIHAQDSGCVSRGLREHNADIDKY